MLEQIGVAIVGRSGDHGGIVRAEREGWIAVRYAQALVQPQAQEGIGCDPTCHQHFAAHRREQLIAVVRVATELSAAQRQRLLAALTAAYGQGIHLNVVHDPAVVGGVSVQIGDELIDGTAASRLADVRRRLAG